VPPDHPNGAISLIDVYARILVTYSFLGRHFTPRFERKFYNKPLHMKLLSILLLVASALFADSPGTIAIHNARVIPVSGPAISHGID
jgi:hypothetical protein